ncbi:MAG TPA: glutamate--tRNA ligase [Bacteroidota bacterium]|nr:glutamate--tRNA ligase [Bacteroidota bacterium]
MNNGQRQVRVRFAPSPTGYLHVGGLRTALYNFLFARHTGGVFILRIEDTDRSRYVEGAVENLIATLGWAGLSFDEGPGKGGAYGPYVQSERLDIYRKHAGRLVEEGKAYYCFCAPERLEQMRKRQEAEKLPFKYDRECLRLAPAESAAKLQRGEPHVIRLKVPDGRAIRFADIIRESVEIDAERIDDQVLLKSDGYPTYHLANVVDDHLMGVTHVIRGEEWLSSTPKHVILYEYFGWDLPVFAHLPLLLNPDRSKLSKRQGDVAVEEYRRKGYLPEALVNFVAFLGWNPGGTKEIYSIDELIGEFTLDKVNKSGAIFNLEKLNWLNFEHLRTKPAAEVLAALRRELAGSRFSGQTFEDAYLISVIGAMRERVTSVADFILKSPYFFGQPESYEQEAVRKRWNARSPQVLTALAREFSRIPPGSGKEAFEEALHRTAAAEQVPNGELIHPLRLAVSGVSGGPGVFDIVAIIGPAETIGRIRNAIERIPAQP